MFQQNPKEAHKQRQHSWILVGEGNGNPGMWKQGTKERQHRLSTLGNMIPMPRSQKSIDLRRERETHEQALLIVSRTVDLHFLLLSGGEWKATQLMMKRFSNATWISWNTHSTYEVGRLVCHSNAPRPLVKRLLNGRSTWCFYCFFK